MKIEDFQFKKSSVKNVNVRYIFLLLCKGKVYLELLLENLNFSNKDSSKSKRLSLQGHFLVILVKSRFPNLSLQEYFVFSKVSE